MSSFCALIDKSLRARKRGALEYASYIIFGYAGRLDESEATVCDHDVLYTKGFRETLEGSGVEVIRTPIGCPQQNGYAERFVKSIKTECLDHFIFLGEKPLRRAVEQYVKHYHHERNHQGLDNVIPLPKIPGKPNQYSTIRKSERLGGLLNFRGTTGRIAKSQKA